MKIAVIPARGGSKRIPRKNIKEFSGQPMIAYAIRAARESQLFDRVVVSTDDSEIAEIAINFGAEVPFLRPAELANDHTPTVPVIAHAIRELNEQGAAPDLVCCIYPGVPLIRPEDLAAAYQLLLSTKATVLVGGNTDSLLLGNALGVLSGSLSLGEVSSLED